MNATDTSRLKNIIKQVDAIFAFEGFQPIGSILDTDRAVLAGVGTYAESTKELVEYVKTLKTAKGFVYSKTPGLF